jgi:polysaccharide biosynthesis protein PelF
VRVLFVTEASYPHNLSGISNWSRDLITGLPQHRFVVLALTPAKRQAILYERPQNVERLINVPLGLERSNVREANKNEREAFTQSINEVLGFLARDLPRFTKGLRDLALLGHEVNLWPLFEERALWRRVQSLLRPRLPYTPSLAEIALCLNWLRKSLVPLMRLPPQADLVHTTVNSLGAIPAWLASHLHGVPLLLTEHHVALRERYLKKTNGTDLLALKRFQTSFYEMLSRLMYWQADRIVAVSEFNRTWQLRFAAPRERTRVIQNGIDLKHPSLLQPELYQGERPPTLVWLGRIDPLKDLETLLAAFWQVKQQLSNARLKLFGPAPQPRYFARLQQHVAQLGLAASVTFEGVVRHGYQAFAQGDIVVSSSKSEGFPLGLLEAMAYGKAIVATRVGGSYELLQDAGRTVPPQSPTALATSLIDLLQHPEDRLRLGQRARERAKTFALDKMLASYSDLYDELVRPLRPREAPAFLTMGRVNQTTDLTLLNGNGNSFDPTPEQDGKNGNDYNGSSL